MSGLDTPCPSWPPVRRGLQRSTPETGSARQGRPGGKRQGVGAILYEGAGGAGHDSPLLPSASGPGTTVSVDLGPESLPPRWTKVSGEGQVLSAPEGLPEQCGRGVVLSSLFHRAAGKAFADLEFLDEPSTHPEDARSGGSLSSPRGQCA